jgi:integrase
VLLSATDWVVNGQVCQRGTAALVATWPPCQLQFRTTETPKCDTRSAGGPSAGIVEPDIAISSWIVEQEQVASLSKNVASGRSGGRDIVSAEANLGRPSKGDFESMARRRFQDPRPKRRGKWWTIQVRRDDFVGGQLERRKTRVRIAPASVPEREARKIAAEYLRPQNQGLELIGSATNFTEYVDNTYKPLLMPLMAKTTQERTRGVIANYLVPEFGKLSLRDLTPLTVQRYFSGFAASPLAHESKDKIRDVLSSILGSAVQYGLLVKNPVEGVRIPAEKRGKRKTKPHVTPEQFEELLKLIPEPYASMVFVVVWTGLRVSELIGLRWDDVGADSLKIDERCCRGDWDAPKSDASNATIGVEHCVIERINRLNCSL